MVTKKKKKKTPESVQMAFAVFYAVVGIVIGIALTATVMYFSWNAVVYGVEVISNV